MTVSDSKAAKKNEKKENNPEEKYQTKRASENIIMNVAETNTVSYLYRDFPEKIRVR